MEHNKVLSENKNCCKKCGSYEHTTKECTIKDDNIQKESSFQQFMADAQAARDRQKKKISDRKKKDAQYTDTRKHGVKFYDKKGSGRLVGGRKKYD